MLAIVARSANGKSVTPGLKYMRLTGRKEEHVELVKAYLEQNNMFFTVDKEDPEYT
jgi:aconitase A